MIVEKNFFRLLILAALADWLVSRTLARVAIFIPKTPALIAAYQGIIFTGQYASVLSALLILFGIGWIAWHLRQKDGGIPSILLVCLLLLSLVLLLPQPNGWLQLIALVLVLGVIGWLSAEAWKSTSGTRLKATILIPSAAVFTGILYHFIQSSYSLLRLPGPPIYVQALFNFGEILVVLTPFCMWWVYRTQNKGRQAIRAYTWGLLAAILFMAFRLANPAMAGILAIWSTGLTLYLPAPIYAAALGFGVATVLLSRSRGNSAGMALLLLACAGYAPQLSSQIFLSLIALSLLAGVWQEPDAAKAAHSISSPSNVLYKGQDARPALGSEHGRA